MAEYVYPAVFHPNDDGSFTITYPDLPGNAMYMAQSALTQWIEYLTDKKQDVPMASGLGSLETEPGEFVNLIRADIKDGRAVKRTVSIPKWMDDKVAETGLSRVLQDALKERLNVG